ncbi:MAG TPA: hypothetical protein VMP01_03195 [Pirellulaceae bacterium]|nr:hypothetical protein [Pirellulaceae bacterium]
MQEEEEEEEVKEEEEEEEVTVEMVVADRVRALVENSLPYIDADKFNADDDRRWAFVCFVVGAVFGSSFDLSRAQVQAISMRVIVDVFKWPDKGVLYYVTDAMAEADQGLNKEVFEGGMAAIAEFEHAIGWLHAICEAITPKEDAEEGEANDD